VADASKLKQLRRGGLGAPPSPDEARTDLRSELPQAQAHHAYPDRPAESAEKKPESPGIYPNTTSPRVDGRTLRRSGRTVQFATRVSPEFDARVRAIAQREKLLLVEVLERALDSYEAGEGRTHRTERG
jgi:hypothetical protein